MSNHGTPCTIGQFNEIASNVLRALNKGILPFNPKDVIRVSQQGEVLERAIAEMFGKLVNGHAAPATSDFTYDKRKDGWKLLEDVGFIPAIASLDQLDPVPFLKDGEKYVNGETVAARAVEMGANLGQKHAEYLLEHQGEIPKEFRKYYLVFPGTKWRHSDGDRSVPCLGWYGGEWCLGWDWLDGDCWHGSGRLLRLRG